MLRRSPSQQAMQPPWSSLSVGRWETLSPSAGAGSWEEGSVVNKQALAKAASSCQHLPLDDDVWRASWEGEVFEFWCRNQSLGRISRRREQTKWRVDWSILAHCLRYPVTFSRAVISSHTPILGRAQWEVSCACQAEAGSVKTEWKCENHATCSQMYDHQMKQFMILYMMCCMICYIWSTIQCMMWHDMIYQYTKEW